MDGVGYLPDISFGRIYSTSFFVRTANEASGGQRIGALKEIMYWCRGSRATRLPASSGIPVSTRPTSRPPCNARSRPTMADKDAPIQELYNLAEEMIKIVEGVS